MSTDTTDTDTGDAPDTTGTDEAGTEVEVAEAPAESDDRRDALLAELSAALGDALVESHVVPGADLWIRVDADRWVDAITAVRDLGFAYFGFLSGIDWRISEWGRYEDTPFDDDPLDDDEGARTVLPEGPGYAGGDSPFQLLVRLHDIGRGLGVNIKADLDEAAPEVPTITRVFPGADWHERETREMFGFNFVGHPHLVNLYLPTEFEGFPLRKDFPLLARVVKPWPGVVDIEPIPEHLEAALEKAVMEQAEAEEAAT